MLDLRPQYHQITTGIHRVQLNVLWWRGIYTKTIQVYTMYCTLYYYCVCVCVRACMRACLRACVRVCVVYISEYSILYIVFSIQSAISFVHHSHSSRLLTQVYRIYIYTNLRKWYHLLWYWSYLYHHTACLLSKYSKWYLYQAYPMWCECHWSLCSQWYRWHLKVVHPTSRHVCYSIDGSWPCCYQWHPKSHLNLE